MSKNTTAAIFTQDRWSGELKLSVIPGSDFEIEGASAFMLSPHQQHEKYNTPIRTKTTAFSAENRRES
jgi:hypothetical protein